VILSFGALLAAVPGKRINPEEIGGDTEGDILLTPEQKKARSGQISSQYRWKNGRIPYYIDQFDYG
jgi:hypothetical protein